MRNELKRLVRRFSGPRILTRNAVGRPLRRILLIHCHFDLFVARGVRRRSLQQFLLLIAALVRRCFRAVLHCHR